MDVKQRKAVAAALVVVVNSFSIWGFFIDIYDATNRRSPVESAGIFSFLVATVFMMVLCSWLCVMPSRSAMLIAFALSSVASLHLVFQMVAHPMDAGVAVILYLAASVLGTAALGWIALTWGRRGVPPATT